jgi:hypothetical protein
VDKQELKQLIKDGTFCTYSEATIDYLIARTSVQLVPTFTCNGGVKFTDISKYINYFFNIDEYQQPLIDNGDVDTSDVMTKFKVDDVVYYFDKHHVALIRGQITSIDNKVNLTQYLEKGPSAYSIVGIKRLDEAVDFVCDCIRNEDLFLTLEDATQALIDNTFKLEKKRKQEKYNQLVQDELNKFNSINFKGF